MDVRDVDEVSTDSDAECYEDDPSSEIGASSTHTPAKELMRAKRTERDEEPKEPTTEHKPKASRPIAPQGSTPCAMQYKYDEDRADREFQSVDAVGLSLARGQSVMSITSTPNGESPVVRCIARKHDNTFSCARAGEDGTPLPGDKCMALYHAATFGKVCPHIKNLLDGKAGTFYKW